MMINSKALTKKEAKEIRKRTLNEAKSFMKKYLTNNDALSITLKSHLFIEKQLEIMISNSVTKITPKQLSDLKFSQKVNYLEQLGYGNFPGHAVIEKLRALNRLRNYFGHKIDYEISGQDNNFQILIKGATFSNDATIETKLKNGICYLLGHLTVARDLANKLPFLSSVFRNKYVWSKDDGFVMETILDYYRELGLNDFFQEMAS